MSIFGPHSSIPFFPSVWLHGVNEAVRFWVMAQAPEAQYSLTRSESTTAVVYSSDYLRRLMADFSDNTKHETRGVLCLLDLCSDSYLDLLRLHIRHIIYLEAPFAEEAIRLAINPQNVLQRRANPFLSTENPDELEGLENWTVRSRDDVNLVMDNAQNYFERNGHSAPRCAAAGLAVKEAVTNCIFHGFRRPGSHERKYEPDDFIALDDSDQVEVRAAHTDNMIVLRISDNAGVLSALRVGNSLDRQKSDRGLMDRRGRGFYLMNQMTDRTVIVVFKGASTTLELYFLKDPPASRLDGERLRHFELMEFDAEA